MGGDVVQRFFVQLVGVEEGLQAVQLLGEGHYRATLGINDDRILASCGACEAKDDAYRRAPCARRRSGIMPGFCIWPC
ncbi:hypothetical protein D3C75_1203490 [compost metagenome]